MRINLGFYQISCPLADIATTYAKVVSPYVRERS